MTRNPMLAVPLSILKGNALPVAILLLVACPNISQEIIEGVSNVRLAIDVRNSSRDV